MKGKSLKILFIRCTETIEEIQGLVSRPVRKINMKVLVRFYVKKWKRTANGFMKAVFSQSVKKKLKGY